MSLVRKSDSLLYQEVANLAQQPTFLCLADPSPPLGSHRAWPLQTATHSLAHKTWDAEVHGVAKKQT